eukprot:GEMP01016912.1.p1 GENE.GEMP01016912.1~~GEMP01016912.1.p1  ORF type:complete len:554 (+),score=63.39 GEMP01016912.1:271-1932(+)
MSTLSYLLSSLSSVLPVMGLSPTSFHHTSTSLGTAAPTEILFICLDVFLFTSVGIAYLSMQKNSTRPSPKEDEPEGAEKSDPLESKVAVEVHHDSLHSEILRLLPVEFSRARRLYTQLSQPQLPKDPQFWMELVVACVRVDDSQFCKKVITDIINFQIELKVPHFAKIMRYCFCRKYYALMCRFEECYCFPRDNHDCLYTLAKAHFEIGSERACKILQALFQLPTASSRDALSPLRICADKGQGLTCYQIFREVQKVRQIHDESFLRQTLCALVASHPVLAYDLLIDCAMTRNPQPLEETYSEMIKLFVAANNIDMAIKVYESCRKAKTLMELITSCANRDALKSTAPCAMSLNPTEINSDMVNNILMRYIRANLVNNAMDFYVFTKDLCTAEPFTCIALIKAQFQFGNANAYLSILDDMVKHKFILSDNLLWELLQSCVLNNNVAASRKIFRKFTEGHNVRPTSSIISTYVKLLSRDGDLVGAFDLIQTQKKRFGVPPSALSFRHFFGSCVRLRKPLEAAKAYEWMNKVHTRIDEKCLELLGLMKADANATV